LPQAACAASFPRACAPPFAADVAGASAALSAGAPLRPFRVVNCCTTQLTRRSPAASRVSRAAVPLQPPLAAGNASHALPLHAGGGLGSSGVPRNATHLERLLARSRLSGGEAGRASAPAAATALHPHLLGLQSSAATGPHSGSCHPSADGFGRLRGAASASGAHQEPFPAARTSSGVHSSSLCPALGLLLPGSLPALGLLPPAATTRRTGIAGGNSVAWGSSLHPSDAPSDSAAWGSSLHPSDAPGACAAGPGSAASGAGPSANAPAGAYSSARLPLPSAAAASGALAPGFLPYATLAFRPAAAPPTELAAALTGAAQAPFRSSAGRFGEPERNANLSHNSGSPSATRGGRRRGRGRPAPSSEINEGAAPAPKRPRADSSLDVERWLAGSELSVGAATGATMAPGLRAGADSPARHAVVPSAAASGFLAAPSAAASGFLAAPSAAATGFLGAPSAAASGFLTAPSAAFAPAALAAPPAAGSAARALGGLSIDSSDACVPLLGFGFGAAAECDSPLTKAMQLEYTAAAAAHLQSAAAQAHAGASPPQASHLVAAAAEAASSPRPVARRGRPSACPQAVSGIPEQPVAPSPPPSGFGLLCPAAGSPRSAVGLLPNGAILPPAGVALPGLFAPHSHSLLSPASWIPAPNAAQVAAAAATPSALVEAGELFGGSGADDHGGFCLPT
jgi:hypothetical protein